MKILIEPTTYMEKYDNVDGLILSLKDYSVQSINYYTLEEIKKIKDENPELEIFINMNKNILNNEVEPLKEILQEIEEINITGIFFYDLALLQLKKELGLKTDLVWSQTHMVNNYKTCNYYHTKGVKYALIGKEITLEEIIEIIKNTTISPMIEVVSIPSVAFSRRKLLTNYYKDLGKFPKDKLDVVEPVTNETYSLIEDSNGTSFYLKEVTNGTSIIKDLYEAGADYIILREYGIDKSLFYELLGDTKKYIDDKCKDLEYIEKYKKLGDFDNFFHKKTIYKVKKNA